MPPPRRSHINEGARHPPHGVEADARHLGNPPADPVNAGILRQISVGRRNRAFEASEIVEAFTALERRLASPEGDTRTSERFVACGRRR